MVRREILRRPFPLGAFETRSRSRQAVSPPTTMRDVSPNTNFAVISTVILSIHRGDCVRVFVAPAD